METIAGFIAELLEPQVCSVRLDLIGLTDGVSPEPRSIV